MVTERARARARASARASKGNAGVRASARASARGLKPHPVGRIKWLHGPTPSWTVLMRVRFEVKG